ncbi:GntR family transcriptional regulator [Salinarimonas ramus]|uniref:GntR family transcriptional regulator n=1 Tax=Salinarimonas ramus TaxID=690164 RepID=A0A917Q954_9HYPH|nr:GntR family transcriptional regulator [Salinarimonas ramus]GGK36493.1 GntR family transcriptional regulator [Salinarimonas ramus]
MSGAGAAGAAAGGLEEAERPRPGETQAQQAYRQLEEMIVTLALAPGSRISENTMAQRLGIGRTPVREAMQRLALEGTLRILPRAGAIVSEIDLADQFKLIEVRRGLERIMAGRAARLADRETRTRFSALAERFAAAEAASDEALFIPADRDFNALLAASAQNKYAAAAMAPIQAQTRRFWFLAFERFGDIPRVSRLHGAICRAVAEGDEARAQAASDALVDYVEDYTRRTLDALM